MTDDDYKTYIDSLILDIVEHPDYQTADRIAARLVVPHPENDRVMLIAKTACKITPTQFDAALNRRRKAQESEAHAAVLSKRNEALVGCNPSTEREFVAAMVRDLTMDYGRTFTDADGNKQDIDTVLRNIQLTAADLGLTKAPLELRDKNFERALAELCDKRRAERKAAVWEQISRLSDDRSKESVQTAFTRMCQRYFKQPAFAEAALKKVMWQLKVKMQGGYIKHHHAVILFGGQDTGKSWFWNMVSQPVRDLSKVIDVAELVGESQLDLYNYFLIDLDEMAHAEKADIAKLKSLITKQTVSRRVYYTQTLKDVTMCATLIGSANHPIAALIHDATGMRRFIQLDVKPRAQVAPHWDADIAGFDWLGVWQLVDHAGEDPMLPFLEELADQQERMRSKNRVEQWLMDFEYHATHTIVQETSDPPRVVQYSATKLFKIYKQWEEVFAENGRMALGNWGVLFKTLIETGRVPEWEVYEPSASRTYYTYTPNNVVALGLAAPTRSKRAG
jgi:hypothetical protein